MQEQTRVIESNLTTRSPKVGGTTPPHPPLAAPLIQANLITQADDNTQGGQKNSGAPRLKRKIRSPSERSYSF